MVISPALDFAALAALSTGGGGPLIWRSGPGARRRRPGARRLGAADRRARSCRSAPGRSGHASGRGRMTRWSAAAQALYGATSPFPEPVVRP